MKLSFKIFLCCFCIAALFSCSSDDVIDMRENEVPSVSLSYDESLEHFGIMLSKAVSNDENVRKFVKNQVLMKIDNGYNIFYPVVKDKKVVDGTSFRQILMNYATDKKELLEIERNLPLLNIHMPQFDSVKVTSLDVKSDELPVLVNKKLFVKGELVDTIGDLEVPVFNVLVVTESSTIKKKTAGTRSNLALSLNDEFEYTDISFVPRRQETRSLLYDEDIVNDGFEDEEHRKYDIEKYHGKTLPVDSIDPRLVEAFKKSENTRCYTRCFMYYGLKNTSDKIDVNKHLDCQDCIYRFRLNENEFNFYESYQSDNNKYFGRNSITNKKWHLTRSDVLSRLKTGKTIDFLIHIIDTAFQDIAFSVQPEDVFNVSVSYSYTHPTMFRSSKHEYRINFANFKSKWYYPHEHGHDLRLGRWNVFNNAINKRIYFYFVPTKNGQEETITEEATVTCVNSNNVEVKINAELLKNISSSVGYSGSWGTTKTYTVKKEYKFRYKPLLRSDFYINYFDDYPISSIKDNNVIFNEPGGSGAVTFTIMPISNDFYNNKMKK
ncbi:MAG: hypothetical protein IJR86_01495 [Bacteroidaceae bacterium]|nr:hypothetical protein [Bacteroidaceae bacterium]